VVLFSDAPAPPPAAPRSRHERAGWLALLAGAVAAAALAASPAPYVIERPGPVFDTLGESEVQGAERPLVEIPDATTYPTSGALKLLTVNIEGGPGSLPSWGRVLSGWMSPSESVVPVEQVYPPGATDEQTAEQGRLEMSASQRSATAAALTELGYEFPARLVVIGLVDGPARDVLEEGDVIVEADGEPVRDRADLQRIVRAHGTGGPLPLAVDRDGAPLAVDITPVRSPQDGTTPIIGVEADAEYDFPLDVELSIERVGGPSAGMMFALAIVDRLTPGALTGGEDVAGTGTISDSGEVGPIGGIRQKMIAARQSGSALFLAPEANCDEVVGHVPDGLTVTPVADLDDALAALTAVADGGDPAALPACPAG